MHVKLVKYIEKEDPSEDTLRLTTRWKDITKPGDCRYNRDNGESTHRLRYEQNKNELKCKNETRSINREWKTAAENHKRWRT